MIPEPRFIRACAVAIAAAASIGAAPAREYYDLRTYHFGSEEAAATFDDVMKSAGLKALEKAGATRVGVFKRKPGEGPDTPERYLLAAFPTLDALASGTTSLAAIPGRDDALERYFSTPLKSPAYSRIESTLLSSFEKFPKVEDPAGDGGGERFFELRTYQSHDELKAKLKVEMFNEGGEIAIFRDAGLRPVFFGEALIGPDLPKLTYMLVFDDAAEKDRAWDAFRGSPAWDKLKGDERYADTVSNIESLLLVALPYSPLR